MTRGDQAERSEWSIFRIFRILVLFGGLVLGKLSSCRAAGDFGGSWWFIRALGAQRKKELSTGDFVMILDDPIARLVNVRPPLQPVKGLVVLLLCGALIGCSTASSLTEQTYPHGRWFSFPEQTEIGVVFSELVIDRNTGQFVQRLYGHDSPSPSWVELGTMRGVVDVDRSRLIPTGEIAQAFRGDIWYYKVIDDELIVTHLPFDGDESDKTIGKLRRMPDPPGR